MFKAVSVAQILRAASATVTATATARVRRKKIIAKIMFFSHKKS
jgi:hypothetical protein